MRGSAAFLLVGGIAWTALADIGPHHGRVLTLFEYLLPQAVPVAVPAGLAIGLMTASRRLGRRGGRRLACAAALVCCVAGAVSLDRLVPAANQAARVLVSGRPVKRGANELRFSEMRQHMNPHRAKISDYFESSDGTYPSLTYWFHARLALSASPFVLTLLVVIAARQLRPIALRVITFSAVCGFIGCYVTIPPSAVASAIERGLLPWLAAWTPNLALLAITGLISVQRQASAS